VLLHLDNPAVALAMLKGLSLAVVTSPEVRFAQEALSLVGRGIDDEFNYARFVYLFIFLLFFRFFCYLLLRLFAIF
jgi:hypothetical protein